MQKIVAETNLYNMQKDPNNKNIHSIGYQKVFWDIAVHVSAKVSKYQSILAPSSWLWFFPQCQSINLKKSNLHCIFKTMSFINLWVMQIMTGSLKFDQLLNTLKQSFLHFPWNSGYQWISRCVQQRFHTF